jgi:hypothetical protein
MHGFTEQDPDPNLCNNVAGMSENKRVDKVWRVRKVHSTRDELCGFFQRPIYKEFRMMVTEKLQLTNHLEKAEVAREHGLAFASLGPPLPASMVAGIEE